MSFINYAQKEIHCKIIYCGPGLCGKTTNIQYIYDQTNPHQKGKLSVHSSENERTLFFDFLPLATGEINGFKVRFHLYSIPGQTFYEVSRQFILKGVDGLIFVVDSQEDRMEENLKSLEELESALEHQGYDLEKLPFAFQYNKRDLDHSMSVSELNATYNLKQKPFFEAIAHQGKGVMETLDFICKKIIQDLKGGKST